MAPLSTFQVPSPSSFLTPTPTSIASGSQTPTLPLSAPSSWIPSHPSFSAGADTDTSTDPAQTSPASTSASTQRGANYFFGFLITFVALLLIFVGCGVGSRRRYAARRRAVMAAVAARPPEDDGKPGVWDVWVRPTRAAHTHKHMQERGPEWDKITPLAARTVRPEAAKAAANAAAGASASTLFLPASVQATRAPTPVLVEPPLISLDLLVPEWILRRREMRAAGMLEKEGKGGKGGKEEEVKEMRMQVTVLVAMPTQRHGHRHRQKAEVEEEEEEEGPGHVEIGVTSVPWRVDEDEDEDDGRS